MFHDAVQTKPVPITHNLSQRQLHTCNLQAGSTDHTEKAHPIKLIAMHTTLLALTSLVTIALLAPSPA